MEREKEEENKIEERYREKERKLGIKGRKTTQCLPNRISMNFKVRVSLTFYLRHVISPFGLLDQMLYQKVCFYLLFEVDQHIHIIFVIQTAHEPHLARKSKVLSLE